MNRQALIDRISDTFCVEPDYLWSKSSDAAVFRHAVSQKWFGLLMSVSPQSLRIPGDARIDILNVKCDPLLNGSLRQRPGFLPAYHMNKELWISIILNEVSDDDVMELVRRLLSLSRSGTSQDKNERKETITMSDAFKKSTYFRSRKTILPLIAVITMLATLFTGFFTGTAEGEDQALAYANQYIDLHLHLDGAITVEIAKKLAELQGFELPTDSDEELEKYLTVPPDCKNLNDFLKCFEIPGYLLQTPEGLREAVHLVADNIKSQGVVYAEIRFAPQFHTKEGMTQEEAIQAALEGLKETELKANLILCCMRGEGNDAQNEETIELASKYLVEDGGVVAVDLAGAEALYPTENYRELFEKAKELDIPFVIHAGEAAGAESVRYAVEFGARRIGHGVRIFEDPEVVALVKEKGVTLEMCPTSNVQTQAIDNLLEYPFMMYLDEGIKVTLNTDDMAIERTTLANEFRIMEEYFNLRPEQERILLANAVDAAFTTDAVKNQLREILGLDAVIQSNAA